MDLNIQIPHPLAPQLRVNQPPPRTTMVVQQQRTVLMETDGELNEPTETQSAIEFQRKIRYTDNLNNIHVYTFYYMEFPVGRF